MPNWVYVADAIAAWHTSDTEPIAPPLSWSCRSHSPPCRPKANTRRQRAKSKAVPSPECRSLHWSIAR
jgi:hypothetical protein